MKAFYNKNIDPLPANEMNRYILEGGFPRTIQLEHMADKRTYVQGVVREIFEKDIRHRVKIREKETFEAVKTYIINNFGAAVSINSLCSALRKNGLSVSRATLVRNKYNTSVIIKYPFWRMTASNPQATYACINYGEAVCPEEIEKRSMFFINEGTLTILKIPSIIKLQFSLDEYSD